MSSTINHFTSQSKTEAYKRIEAILEKAGPAGVHRAHFLYTLFWSQHSARITEMNSLGWVIESVTLPKSRWQRGIRTKYVLRSKPLEVAPGEDWYVKLKGCPRPAPVAATSDLPLFAESSL